MIRIVKPHQRDLQLLDIPGATVQISDPIIGKENNLAAGFTEYIEPSRLEWTFTYDEVFFMLKGALEVHAAGQDPVGFEPGGPGLHREGHPDHDHRAGACLPFARHSTGLAGSARIIRRGFP